MSGHDIIDLNKLGSQVMENTDKLRSVSMRLHGYENPDQNGEVTRVNGVQLQYEEHLDEELLAIFALYEDEGKRPPAEDIRAARARQAVKRKYPDLVDEYHILTATMKRLERWLRDARSATMARQSVLKSERELAGKPGGYQ